ncbi:hypothetical protein NQ317_017853 [Molorchus minor]|uniref:Uncharacterized protein n=1 Tax=Molorchus minor TaxID=1323400 RepID=A0ABQ9K2M0_9CUCU|nr:hypothetical protein NQ317_017853 [Molorchus minor]
MYGINSLFHKQAHSFKEKSKDRNTLLESNRPWATNHRTQNVIEAFHVIPESGPFDSVLLWFNGYCLAGEINLLPVFPPRIPSKLSLKNIFEDGFLWAVPKHRRSLEKRLKRKFGSPEYTLKNINT